MHLVVEQESRQKQSRRRLLVLGVEVEKLAISGYRLRNVVKVVIIDEAGAIQSALGIRSFLETGHDFFIALDRKLEVSLLLGLFAFIEQIDIRLSRTGRKQQSQDEEYLIHLHGEFPFRSAIQSTI